MPQPACKHIRDDLVSCLLRTDCVLRSGKTPQECLRSPQELPAQCQHLITAFTDCKKGMLDMRRRFRGNHLSSKEDPQAEADRARLAAPDPPAGGVNGGR